MRVHIYIHMDVLRSMYIMEKSSEALFNPSETGGNYLRFRAKLTTCT